MDSNKFELNLKKQFKNKVVLITGGAGSIGSELAKKILEYPVKAVRILDIDEHALFTLNRSVNDVRLRPLLGSVTDLERLEMAGNKVDIIIHAAAIKNIEITEFNPIETIQVNTMGTVNMINMVIKNKPEKFLNISTDKAAEPSTLYGTTKQLGERLTSWAGVHIMDTKFATIRFGNVIETRGNVFEIWKNQNKNGIPLSITDPLMERYFFHVDEAIKFILNCLLIAKEGEIFVPKMKLQKVVDLASKVSKKHKIIGLRQGEKLKEILISESEKEIAQEKKDLWAIKYYKKGYL
jgi:UDP-N-acetylglucosamine 4,6-dehydratase/5-epimerase